MALPIDDHVDLTALDMNGLLEMAFALPSEGALSDEVRKLHAALAKDTVRLVRTASLDSDYASRESTPQGAAAEEPLLLEETDRKFQLFPSWHPDIMAMFRQHTDTYWTPQEIDYSGDRADWQKLTKNEQHFIKTILSFFAGSDFVVSQNLTENFQRECPWYEVQFFYAIQNFMECIHSQTYAELISEYAESIEEQKTLSQAVFDQPAVCAKTDWAVRYMDANEPFASRLIAFVIMEGLFFSSAFCSIFWIKSKGLLLSGLCKSNELIARDEGLHCEFGVLLYTQHIVNKLSEEEVHAMFRSAVVVEDDFVDHALPVRLIGMNADQMKEYVRFIADFWLVKLGYTKLFNTANPFQFMENIALEGKCNFFESRETEYTRFDSGGTLEFEGDVDF